MAGVLVLLRAVHLDNTEAGRYIGTYFSLNSSLLPDVIIHTEIGVRYQSGSSSHEFYACSLASPKALHPRSHRAFRTISTHKRESTRSIYLAWPALHWVLTNFLFTFSSPGTDGFSESTVLVRSHSPRPRVSAAPPYQLLREAASARLLLFAGQQPDTMADTAEHASNTLVQNGGQAAPGTDSTQELGRNI
jgi:hypothetical protein